MSYIRSAQDKARARKLYSESKTRNGGWWLAYYNEELGRWFDISGIGRYPGYAKWVRRQANRRVRYSQENYKRGEYRKLFDCDRDWMDYIT